MLELTEQNFNVVEGLRDKDIAIRDRWYDNGYTTKAKKIIPTAQAAQAQFIRDWLSVSPQGTLKKLQEYEVELRTKAIKEKIQLDAEKITALLTRKIAMIKRDYTAQHDDLIKRYAKYYNIKNLVGYTYLEEIVEYLSAVIKNIEKKYPRLIVKFEGKTPRRKV